MYTDIYLWLELLNTKTLIEGYICKIYFDNTKGMYIFYLLDLLRSTKVGVMLGPLQTNLNSFINERIDLTNIFIRNSFS